uniref:Uncharacterized protein n=1 Tax=Romanomermis culicivorax TaxID=13658 RepID=A0A915IUV9_ROMCU
MIFIHLNGRFMPIIDPTGQRFSFAKNADFSKGYKSLRYQIIIRRKKGTVPRKQRTKLKYGIENKA